MILNIDKLAQQLHKSIVKGATTMVWKLRKKDIPPLSLGAKFLASGGGGDTFTLQHLLHSVMDDGQEISVYPFSEIGDQQHVVTVSTIGSSLLCDEKLSTGEEGRLVLDEYEKLSGKKADLLIALGTGGPNALIPFILAAQVHLPVVDGDGMARTFPEYHMTSFHAMGVKLSPMVMCNQHREVIHFPEGDNMNISVQTRKAVQLQGGIAYTAGYGMAGKMCKTAIIPNTIDLILQLGRIFADERELSIAIEKMRRCFANSVFGVPKLLIQGKIYGIKRWFHGESIESSFEVLGMEQWDGQSVEIHVGNEYLSVKKGKQYLCLTPDIILILDEETGEPCLVDDIQEGLPVSVFGIPVPNILRSGSMLQLVGPHVYDIPANFAPVEYLTEWDERHEDWD